jgi:hypothetical protein
MQLQIGSKVYQFRIIPGLLMNGSKAVSSIVNHNKGEILVWGKLPESVRMEIAAAAINDAWTYQMAQQAPPQPQPLPFVGEVD